MKSILQNELSSGKNVIYLPIGEFKESIIIDRPCTIIGNNTTLWNDNNPILIVRSMGVVLKNLRLELTAISGYESDYAVLQLQPDTIVENIEIFGGVADTKKFYIPRSVHLGEFKSGVENTFKISMYLPERCQVKVNSLNFSVSSNVLNEGYVDLIIKTNSISDKCMLHGEILLISKLIRRIYIDGTSLENAPYQVDKQVYSYNNIQKDITSDVFSINIPKVQHKPNITSKAFEVKVLQCGQSYILESSNVIMKLNYAKTYYNLDIDPYIFLTDETNHTRYDDDMIFFGNTYSKYGAICIQKDSCITMEINKLPEYVQRVSICYSIYKGDYFKNFSVVKNLSFSIFENNVEKYKILLNDLGNLSTVLLAEFYRYKGVWKINPIVAGYSGGLPKLCQSFGIDAEY